MTCPECKYGHLIFRESSGREPHGEITDCEFYKCSCCGEVWDADDPELEEIANADDDPELESSEEAACTQT